MKLRLLQMYYWLRAALRIDRLDPYTLRIRQLAWWCAARVGLTKSDPTKWYAPDHPKAWTNRLSDADPYHLDRDERGRLYIKK